MPTAQTPRKPAEVIDEAANRLLVAGYTNTPCDPVRDLIGAEDVDAAYAVQEVLTGARVEEGAAIVGRKIGLTSEAVQQQLGVSQPDFGMLFDNMVFRSGDTIPFAAVLQPRVEAEIAFVLKDDLVDGPLDLGQIRDAVDFAVAALEVCGSRVRDWDITFADTVADNASSGAFVLGTERRTLAAFEPRDVQMTMRVTDQDDANGTGAACLGDPLVALQWLAVQARDLGSPLLAGQVILSGALGPMRPVQPGAVAHAEITGLGSVSVRFSSKDT